MARARQGWRPSPPAVQIAIELPNPSKPLGSGRKELRFPPYRTVELPRNNRTSIHEESPEKLRLLVTRVVEAEGPVHIDLLTERLRRHYGAGRAGRQIQTAIESAAKAESRLGRIYWRGDFLDASQQPVRPEPRGAAQDGSVRNIEHIWEGEIEAGVLQIVEAAFGISREDAVVAAARAFGYDRVGPKIRETVQQVVERLLAKGEIAETPAGLTTPS